MTIHALAPSGEAACAPFGFLKWITLSSGKKMFTSSMPGMVLTCSGGVSASRRTLIGTHAQTL